MAKKTKLPFTVGSGLRHLFSHPVFYPQDVAFANNGRYVVFPRHREENNALNDNDGFHVIETSSGTPITPWKGNEPSISPCFATHEDKLAFFINETLYVREIPSGKLLLSHHTGSREWVRALPFSPDGKRLFLAKLHQPLLLELTIETGSIKEHTLSRNCYGALGSSSRELFLNDGTTYVAIAFDDPSQQRTQNFPRGVQQLTVTPFGIVGTTWDMLLQVHTLQSPALTTSKEQLLAAIAEKQKRLELFGAALSAAGKKHARAASNATEYYPKTLRTLEEQLDQRIAELPEGWSLLGTGSGDWNASPGTMVAQGQVLQTDCEGIASFTWKENAPAIETELLMDQKAQLPSNPRFRMPVQQHGHLVVPFQPSASKAQGTIEVCSLT